MCAVSIPTRDTPKSFRTSQTVSSYDDSTCTNVSPATPASAAASPWATVAYRESVIRQAPSSVRTTTPALPRKLVR